MKRLDWDSEFFGLEIGRAESASLADEVAAARRQGIRCLYVATPLGRAVEPARAGGLLVDLRAELVRAPSAVDPAEGIREATPADAPWLAEVAPQLAAHSRFSRDPSFPRERVEEMYGIWIENCLSEGEVSVAADGSAAFVAAREGRIELVYVAPALAGAGLGARLLAHSLARAPGTAAAVATQAANLPALRLYHSLGFRLRSLDAIFHLWPDPSP
jgi:ribosomal protein S18 acetylase RimI-like enzyme